jgi:hypothetical protein
MPATSRSGWQRLPQRSRLRGFTAAGDFAVLPQLHDAELNGSVTWWKPDDGFSVQRTDGFVIAPIAGAGVFLNGGLLI